MNSTPMAVPVTVPLPPESAAPPMMVAAIASNSSPTAIVEFPDASSPLCSSPVTAAAMAEMAPVLEENGWFLIGGFTPGIGRLGAVYHVWRVPSANGVQSALEVVRSHPDAKRWHDNFAESVEDEALELVRPTSYSRSP